MRVDGVGDTVVVRHSSVDFLLGEWDGGKGVKDSVDTEF